MTDQNSIQEIFFKCLLQLKFNKEDLDYSVINKHLVALETLSTIGNSGVSVFDLCKIENLFYSSNFGSLLGYVVSDYEKKGHEFFEQKMHPDDKLQLSINGVSFLRKINDFINDEKLNYKFINEYRMLNAQGNYVRLIEQYQILELDKSGQIWLLMSIVDLSPNQEEYNGVKSLFLNFKTGKVVHLDAAPKVDFELTKRELEILKLVKDGLLSKEIANKLSISLHTVNTHRQRFLEKLGANNSFEAVTFAFKFGLLT